MHEPVRVLPRRDSKLSALYRHGAVVVWLLTFFACWVYCIRHYGVSYGVGLGWLPAILVATVAGALWPLLVAFAAVLGWACWNAR